MKQDPECTIYIGGQGHSAAAGATFAVTAPATGNRVQVDGLDGTTFFAPTLLADVTPDMLISREETFGPTATRGGVAMGTQP